MESEFIEVDGRKVEFKNDARKEILYFKKIYLIVGARLARLLLKTRITANQVSAIHLALGLISIAFFLQVQYTYLLTGMVLFQIGMIFDCADGSIARTRGQASSYGKFVDFTSDRVTEFLVFFVLVYVAFMQTGNVLIWIIGALAIGAESLIVTHKMSLQYLYNLPQDSLGSSVKKRRRLLGLVTYTSFTSHFLMIFAVILNQIFWFVVIMAAYFWAFYLALLALSHRELRRMV